MGILNYTTEIPTSKTIMEIETMLTSHGAQRIIKDYDGAQNITSINFVIDTSNGLLPFKLPMNLRAVQAVINKQTGEYRRTKSGNVRMVPKKFFNDADQARRVGWRIVKDWLEAQLAMLELEMVKIEELFLPYIVGLDGRTLFQQLENGGFKGFLLEDKTSEMDLTDFHDPQVGIQLTEQNK